jgi:ribulose-phosphate 3-epimerase
VSNKNVMLLKEVGVDIVVAGSYVFNHPNKQEAIKSLQV